MDERKLKTILQKVRRHQMTPLEALEKLRTLPFEDMQFAKVDHHRALRKGLAEVVYCPGKTIPQIQAIVKKLCKQNANVLATRASVPVFKAVKKVEPAARFVKEANLVVVHKNKTIKNPSSFILVITAGTADIPVAEEASVTAEVMGNRVKRLYDVGVAGIHRLLTHKELLFEANVLVVAAGMEGALPSVVGGLVNKPVIAVPTSVGYGANFKGLAALLSMLNTCAPGVAVVNIDNGFGAGYLAGLLNR